MKATQFYMQTLPRRRFSIIQICQMVENGTANTLPYITKIEIKKQLKNNIEANQFWLSEAQTTGQREAHQNTIKILNTCQRQIKTK